MLAISKEDLLEYVGFLEESSLDRIENAYAIKEKNLASLVRNLFEAAYDDAIKSANLCRQSMKPHEPTVHVMFMYRSAAHFAHEAGMQEEAKAAAEKCLSFDNDELKEEMMPYIEEKENNNV